MDALRAPQPLDLLRAIECGYPQVVDDLAGRLARTELLARRYAERRSLPPTLALLDVESFLLHYWASRALHIRSRCAAAVISG